MSYVRMDEKIELVEISIKFLNRLKKITLKTSYRKDLCFRRVQSTLEIKVKAARSLKEFPSRWYLNFVLASQRDKL